MPVITVPVTNAQKKIIEDVVKSGRAASKAHAMRMGIALLALQKEKEEALERIRKSLEDIKAGRVYKGDLRKLLKEID